MEREHKYELKIEWTGNNGSGTSGYRDYSRNHTISAAGKETLEGSADPNFHGEASKYNPEELFLSALSSCHMLWYLHFCADARIIVTSYIDKPVGLMSELAKGGGHFTMVTLHPEIIITDSTKIELAISLHKNAHEKCFIANSVNFPVTHQPTCKV
ncbi:MAG: OsmC family protein [Bacteroidia bacterium]|nr:OsmC family protein [Bacteroidia bacterium]